MAMTTMAILPEEFSEKAVLLGNMDEGEVGEMANMIRPPKGTRCHNHNIYQVVRHWSFLAGATNKKLVSMNLEKANLDRHTFEFFALHYTDQEEGHQKYPVDSADRNSVGPTGPGAPSMLQRLSIAIVKSAYYSPV